MPDRCVNHLVFRPSREPGGGLPLGARSVGHYIVPPDFRDHVAVKPFLQVFWGVRGTGALIIDGAERLLKPGCIAVYLPGMEHRVYARDEWWEYRWWTMDGPLATDIAAAYRLEPAVYDAGPPLEALFGELESLIGDPTPRGERLAGAAAYRLLALAAGGRRVSATSSLVDRALTQMHQHWQGPDLCVNTLADRLGVHRSHLARRFRQAMGMTVQDYLMRLRVQHALGLLSQTDRPIHEVARACGYRDPNYFSRLIRRHMGVSPQQFRRERG